MLAVKLCVPGSNPRAAKMVRNRVKNELYVTVPPFFKCPISLDIMKSPVSLSTGVTYDRSSIQKWLDEGNNTCPATMQILQSKEIIPNFTLRRLIQVWSVSNHISANSPDSSSATSSQNTHNSNLNNDNNLKQVGPREAKDILQELRDGAVDSDMLNALLKFAAESEKNRDSLVRAGAVPVLAEILSLPEKDKESGQISRKMAEIHAQVVNILGLIPHNEATVRILAAPEPLSSIVNILRSDGSLGVKIESLRLLESLAIDGEMKTLIASREGLMEALLSLIEASNDSPRTTDAGLRCLLSLCAPKRNRVKVIRLGAVGQMTRVLGLAEGDNAERVLGLLELISACADGRNSICEQKMCIPAVVQKMLKVSDAATEHCVIILWAVCCVSCDQRARDAVVKSGGVAKILLLMQSNCSPAVRQMAAELLKICREMSKNFIPNYDSKMTHIMPF